MTSSPAALPTGMLSPVTMLSSTAERPSTTTPSTAIFSPGRTRTTSPTATAAIGTSTLVAVTQRRAPFAARGR